MKLIWRLNKKEVTVRDVYEELRLRRRIAYTSVMGTMQSLGRKGFLRKWKEGRAHIYQPTRPWEEVIREVVADLVERGIRRFQRGAHAAPGRAARHLQGQASRTGRNDRGRVMSLELSLSNLWFYSLQTGILILVGGLLAWISRLREPGGLHLYWRLLLAGCLVLAFQPGIPESSPDPVGVSSLGVTVLTVSLGGGRRCRPSHRLASMA